MKMNWDKNSTTSRYGFSNLLEVTLIIKYQNCETITYIRQFIQRATERKLDACIGNAHQPCRFDGAPIFGSLYDCTFKIQYRKYRNCA